MPRFWIRSALIVLVATVLALPARAVTLPVYLWQWGSQGSGPGQLNEPRGIALDPSEQFLYVVDRGNHRVQKFTTAGAFVCEWGGVGDGAGTFTGPDAIAVDRHGDVYVADNTAHLVQKFTPTGQFLLQWICNNRSVASHGEFVYVTDAFHGTLLTYDLNGTQLSVTSTLATGDNGISSPRGVVIDKRLGRVMVAEYTSSRAKVVEPGWGVTESFVISSNSEFDWLATDLQGNLYNVNPPPPGGSLSIFSNGGSYVYTLVGTGSPYGPFGYVRGIAVDANGTIYMADSGNSRIVAFGYPAVPVLRKSWAQLKANFR